MRPAIHMALVTLAFAGLGNAADAEPKTVCTITVNSADEKNALRERLPQAGYRFVELVEKGRVDWLRGACEKAIACDVLVVSGHFNAGETFYSDDVLRDENLRVDELERASCSNSCPALFSRLKEVYLFGCESLNPDTSKYASSRGESGRDRMRRIFANVPVIYGFPSSAPVGAAAALLINRHFDTGASSIGSGRPSARLLRTFSRSHMSATRGARESDAGAGDRRQICQFVDERLTPAQKLASIHAMMRHDMARAVAIFERIDAMLASVTAAERESQAFVHALAGISADDAIRERFLAAERATAEATVRSRMIALAATLGWLSPQGRRAELAGMIVDVLASRSIGFDDVDLVCSLNDAGDLGGELARVKAASSRPAPMAATAVLACLGDSEARARTLVALAGPDERDTQAAQAYLRHRPVSDPTELRALALRIARMPEARAQIRALDALGRLHIVDREIVDGLVRSFTAATSVALQTAIAEIFLRSDSKAIAPPGLASVLREHRIKSSGGEDLIDVLIGRLQAAS